VPTIFRVIRQIIGENPDPVSVIATLSAEATIQKIKLIPILFTTITDPVNIRLVSNLEKTSHNIKSITNKVQLNLMREIHPQAQKTGIICNVGVANSVIQIKILKTVPARHAVEVKQANSQHRRNLLNYPEPGEQGRHNISAYRQYDHLQYGFHH
jgi:putative ABC transport system substrate-binding protein